MHVDNTNRFDTLPNLSIYKSMGFHSNTVLEVETRMHAPLASRLLGTASEPVYDRLSLS
jgi:hypothetical protein